MNLVNEEKETVLTLVSVDGEVQQSNRDPVNEHDNPNASTWVLEF
jgi:hypothetical protein